MRSLIILEVEHGEDTDMLDDILDNVQTVFPQITNYTVRVDIPECFVLDGPPGGTCTETDACNAVSHFLNCPKD